MYYVFRNVELDTLLVNSVTKTPSTIIAVFISVCKQNGFFQFQNCAAFIIQIFFVQMLILV